MQYPTPISGKTIQAHFSKLVSKISFPAYFNLFIIIFRYCLLNPILCKNCEKYESGMNGSYRFVLTNLQKKTSKMIITQKIKWISRSVSPNLKKRRDFFILVCTIFSRQLREINELLCSKLTAVKSS